MGRKRRKKAQEAAGAEEEGELEASRSCASDWVLAMNKRIDAGYQRMQAGYGIAIPPDGPEEEWGKDLPWDRRHELYRHRRGIALTVPTMQPNKDTMMILGRPVQVLLSLFRVSSGGV